MRLNPFRLDVDACFRKEGDCFVDVFRVREEGEAEGDWVGRGNEVEDGEEEEGLGGVCGGRPETFLIIDFTCEPSPGPDAIEAPPEGIPFPLPAPTTIPAETELEKVG